MSARVLTVRDGGDVWAAISMVVSAVPILAVGTMFPPLGGAIIAVVTAVVYFTVVAFDGRIAPALQGCAVGVGTVALLAVCLYIGSGPLTAVLLLGNAAVFLELSRQVRSRLVYGSGLALLAAGVLAYSITVPLDALIDSSLAIRELGVAALIASTAFAVAAVLAVCATRSLSMVSKESTGVLMAVSGGAVLYAATAAAVTVGVWISPDRTGFVAGHTCATILWMLTATGVIIFGLNNQAYRKAAVGSGLVLAGAALVKLFFFDLATLSGMFRVAAFLVAGLLLLFAASYFGRRMRVDES
ncbi:MAG: DUF2339 domain-containing protein [Rhodococcus sp.]|nr:DUF2339 domain-containing protein [Rhodococcus sp. (in: high G+C Gram-positive bacteria)]